MTSKRIALARMNSELVLREIGDFLIKEITQEGKTGGVLGLSGGVDSTCTAAITKKAFDKYNLTSPLVIGRIYMVAGITSDCIEIHDESAFLGTRWSWDQFEKYDADWDV